MDEVIHYNITVTGDVQGHYFRNTAQGWAANLKINGQIQNRPDGSVFIEAEGTHDNLQRLVANCRQGSPGCRVENVTFSVGSVMGYTSFQVVG